VPDPPGTGGHGPGSGPAGRAPHAAIVRSVIDLAAALDLRVVAEGVPAP
jgi:EAL domain-containing protein (putative c-di-GMP-specific phosphodiesterase class I)